MKTTTILRESCVYAWHATKRHWVQLAPASIAYSLTLFASDPASYVVDEKSEAYLGLS